jgi:hypothetical protein
MFVVERDRREPRTLTKLVYCRCISPIARGKAFGRLRRQQEMDMVRHKAIRPDLDGSFMAALCKQVAIEPLLRVANLQSDNPILYVVYTDENIIAYWAAFSIYKIESRHYHEWIIWRRVLKCYTINGERFAWDIAPSRPNGGKICHNTFNCFLLS